MLPTRLSRIRPVGEQRHFAALFCSSGLLACMLAGCAGSQALTKATAPGECPAALHDGVKVTASVAQVAVPDGVKAPSGPVSLIAGVGRRVLIAIEVPQGLPRVRLLANSLTIATFGGTLAGWARVVEPKGATGRESVQISGNLLRISPFLPGRKLGSYTQSVDVLVVPGGAPVSGLALHPGPMWDAAGRPTAPHDLAIVLAPIVHLKVLDVVAANARLDFTALHRSGAHERWECSVESDFELVDHRSGLPKLWVLRRMERIGAKYPMLALYNQSVGAFPAVFLDPAVAAGFARWLNETHAGQVGRYSIGLMSEANATGFQAASNEDFSELEVEQLGDHGS